MRFKSLLFSILFFAAFLNVSASTFQLGAQNSQATYAPSNIGIIGVKYLHKQGLDSTVIAVYPHTPAEAAGVQVGDRILEVDGLNIIPFTADQVFGMIAGRPGEPVHLKLMRCSHNYGSHLGCHNFDVNLKRMDMNRIASDNIFKIYRYGN